MDPFNVNSVAVVELGNLAIKLLLNCSHLICTSESGEATSARAVASLISKISFPQLYKRRSC